MAPKTLRLTLELEHQHEPITGTISSSDDTLRAFTGWLELASLIEAARRDNAIQSNHNANIEGRARPMPDAQR